MSKHEFKTRYVFAASPREARMAVILALIAGACTSAIAAIPGAAETVEAAKLVSGLTAAEMLTLITLGALALAGYCVKSMIAQATKAADVVAAQATKSAEMNEKAVIALTQIADKMKTMRCLKDGA